MIDAGTVALVLRGWRDDNRRLHVSVKSAGMTGNFLCTLEVVERELVSFVLADAVTGTLSFSLANRAFEFTDYQNVHELWETIGQNPLSL